MKISEQEIQNAVGYTEQDIKDALTVNLSIFTQTGCKPNDENVISYLSSYTMALVESAYRKAKDPVEEPKKTPIEIASHEIYNKYMGLVWFQAVGIGNNELVIYTNTRKFPHELTEYNGFPVTYKYMGKIKPQ